MTREEATTYPLVVLNHHHKLLSFKCPCGCGDQIDHPTKGLRIEIGKRGFTVRPSINIVRRTPRGLMSHWHGFLTDGLWEQT